MCRDKKSRDGFVGVFYLFIVFGIFQVFSGSLSVLKSIYIYICQNLSKRALQITCSVEYVGDGSVKLLKQQILTLALCQGVRVQGGSVGRGLSTVGAAVAKMQSRLRGRARRGRRRSHRGGPSPWGEDVMAEAV